MTGRNAQKKLNFFKTDLLNRILPFWGEHAADFENGGFFSYLDRRGKLLSTEKGGWVQGRATWLFSWVFNEIDPNPRWLRYAAVGADFLKRHAFNADGRAYFLYKADGTPIQLRRYLFSEVFAAMGLAEYSLAANDPDALRLATDTVQVIHRYLGKLPPKFEPAAYELKSHSMTMILINLYQTLRKVTGDESFTPLINRQIDELFTYFVKPNFNGTHQTLLLETVLKDGSLLDTPAGRTVNPGHCIETAWFLMEEADRQKNETLLNKALAVLDGAVERGWDRRYGGLFSFLDATGAQAAPIEWDMKYWWPHCELIYASLLAFKLTRLPRYEHQFKKVFQYTYSHFPDTVYGEWFGYLRRDGSVALTYKANHFKGPFHIPRMEGKCLLLLQDLVS